MARTKDFGSGSSNEEVEALSFTLYDEEFYCIPQVQGSLLISLVKDSQGEDGAKAAATILEFFDKSLTDESAERFTALITSKDKIVNMEKLAEITGWLVEEYTNRPESPAED